MYGIPWRTAASKGAVVTDSIRPVPGNGDNCSSTSTVSDSPVKGIACSSERSIEKVHKASSAVARASARPVSVYCAKEPPTVAAALALAAYCPPKGSTGGGTVRGPPKCPSGAVQDRKGAAGSAVALGTQIFRRAAAGRSYLRGHSLRGCAISSRRVPPLQGERVQFEEEGTAGDGERGAGSQLVPLFEPDHTNDGPACTCLQALEPYPLLCCSAGAYSGNYFFISKDAHGEVLGGGQRLGPSACGGFDVFPGGQSPQQKDANCVLQRHAQTGQQQSPAAGAFPKAGSGRQGHQKALLENACDVLLRRQVQGPQFLTKQLDAGYHRRLEGQEGQQGCEAGPQGQADAALISTSCHSEVKQGAVSHTRNFSCCSVLVPRGAQSQHPQQCEEDDGLQQRQHPGELSPVGSTQFGETGSDSSISDREHCQEEGTDASQLVEKREDKATLRCGAAGKQEKDFTIADVTLQIEHEGLSTVHARIWEDPERKHLEDRLFVEDLSSEEGTWKKVRWARAVPVCRSSSSSPCSRASLDSRSITQGDGTDGGEVSTDSEEAAGEEEKEKEEQEAARGVHKAVAAKELAKVRQGSVTEGSMRGTTLGIPMLEEEEICMIDVTNAPVVEEGAHLNALGTLSRATVNPKVDKREIADFWKDSDVSTEKYQLSGGTSAGPKSCPWQRSQVKTKGTPTPARSAKRELHQAQHSERGVWQQTWRQLERERIELGESSAKQQEARSSKGKALLPAVKNKEGHSQRQPIEKRRYKERRGFYLRKGKRVKTQASSYQLVNFGGRLLRFERGTPLSPLEAFDEFLATFELVHLKDRLLTCLRHRGCCCSRALREEAISAAAVTAPALPTAQGVRPRGLRKSNVTGTDPAVVGVTQRNEEAATASATAKLFLGTVNISSVSTDCDGDPGTDAVTVKADSLAAPKVIWRGEGYRQWISRIRRDKVFPVQAAAFQTCESCTSTLVDNMKLEETRWGALSTAEDRIFSGWARVAADRVRSGSSCPILQGFEDVSGNAAPKAGMHNDVGYTRNQSDDERGGTLRHLFKRRDKAKERPGRMDSVKVEREERGGGAAVAARVTQDELRNGQEQARTGVKHPRNSLHWKEENLHYHICSNCEANPLRWLWRSDPLSLIYEDASICDTGDTRKEPSEGISSRAGCRVGITKAKGAAHEGETLSRATVAASAAFGACGTTSGTSVASDTIKRSPSFPEVFERESLEEGSFPHQDADSRGVPSCVLLSPDEAYRWRMACVELPRHFLPVCRKSRPLIIHDETTGTKLGEVRWSGCILVSEYQDQSSISKTQTKVPSAAAPASVVTAAAAAQPHQQNHCLPAGAAEQHKPSQLSSDEILCVKHLQQEAAPFVRETRVPGSKGLESERGRLKRCTSNSASGFTVLQAVNSPTKTGVQKSSFCSRTEETFATYFETLSPTRISKLEFFKAKQLQPTGSKTGIWATLSESASTQHPSGSPGHFNPLACSSNGKVSTLWNLEDKSDVRVPVCSALQISSISALKGTPDVGSTCPGGRIPNANSRLEEESLGPCKTPDPPHISASDFKSQKSHLENGSDSSVNPLEDCDCWLLSSAATRHRGRGPRSKSFACFPPSSKKRAGAVSASDIYGKEPSCTKGSATTARAAEDGTPVGGIMKAAPLLGEITSVSVGTFTPRMQIPTPVAQIATRSSLPFAGVPSRTTADRRSATWAAESLVFAQKRNHAAVLQKSSMQQESQASVGENSKCGDDAPVEAVAQRLRTSPPSLLLQSRMVKEAGCGITRTMPYEFSISSPTEACGFRETEFPPTSNTETHATAGRYEGVDIRSASPETRGTSEESQLHDIARPQLEGYLEALEEVDTHPNAGQRCAASYRQHAETHKNVNGSMKTVFAVSFLRSPSSAATDTRDETPRDEQTKRSREGNIGVDDLLQWTSATRRRSTDISKNSTIHRTKDSTAASLPQAQASFCINNHKTIAPWETSLRSGITSAAPALCSSRPRSGRESSSTELGVESVSSTPAAPQESSISSRPGPLEKGTAPLSNVSSDRCNLHSSLCVHPVPTGAARKHDAGSAYPAQMHFREQNSRLRVTTGNSLAMTAAAPVFAIVNSVPTAVASTAPGAFTTATGTNHARISDVTSASATPIPALTDSSLKTVSSSILPAPPTLFPRPQTVGVMKVSWPHSASLAASMRDHESDAPAHTDVATTGETRGFTCRAAAANGFFADDAHALTAASAKAGTISEGAIALRRSCFPETSRDVIARSISCDRALAGIAQFPVTLSRFRMGFATSPSGVSGKAFEAGTVPHQSVTANVPAAGIAMPRAVRSSSWRRCNSFYSEERSACHMRQLAPLRTASCCINRPFLIESTCSLSDASVTRETTTIRTGQQQKQMSRDLSSDWDQLRRTTSETEAASGENGPRHAWSAVTADISNANSIALERTAQCGDIHFATLEGGHLPRKSGIEEPVVERCRPQHSSFAAVVDGAATGEAATPGSELRRNSTTVSGSPLSFGESAASPLNRQQIFFYKGPGESDFEKPKNTLTTREGGLSVRSSVGNTCEDKTWKMCQSRVQMEGTCPAITGSGQPWLTDEKCDLHVPTPRTVRMSASNEFAGTQRQQGSDDKHGDGGANPSRDSGEERCEILTTGIPPALNSSPPVRRSIAKHGGKVGDQGKNMAVDGKVTCSHEEDFNAYFNGRHEGAPLFRRRCSQGAPPAAVVSCFGNHVQPTKAFLHGTLRNEEERLRASSQTSGLQHANAAAMLASCSAGKLSRSEVSSIIQEPSDAKVLRFCTVGVEREEAGGYLAHQKSALSLTSPRVVPGEDLRENWLARFPLVHEARHCTSPDISRHCTSPVISSSDNDSEWSCSSEYQEQVELSKLFSVSSSAFDLSKGKDDKRLQEANIEGNFADATSTARGNGESVQQRPVSVPKFLAPVAGAVSLSDAEIQILRGAGGASQARDLFERERVASQVTTLPSSSIYWKQGFSEQQLSKSSTDARTIASMGLSAHTRAEISLPVTERGDPVEDENFAVDSALGLCGTAATGRASSMESLEKTVICLDHQEGLDTHAGNKADVQDAAAHGESNLTQGSIVNQGTSFVAQDVRGSCAESREQQLQREKGKHDAEQRTSPAGDRALGSDSSATGDSGYRTLTRHTQLFPYNSSEALPESCSPKGKGELKRFLLLLGKGLKAKVPPSPPLEGRGEDEEKNTLPCSHQNEEGVRCSAVERGSGFVNLQGNKKAPQWTDLKVESTRPVIVQPRTEILTICAYQSGAEDIDTNRNHQLECKSAKRNFLSFVARPAALPPTPPDAEDGVSAPARESVYCTKGKCSSLPTAPVQPNLQQQTAPAKSTVLDATRVDVFATACLKGGATLERSAPCERVFLSKKDEAFFERQLQLRSTRTGETLQHAETRAHPAWATNTTRSALRQGGVTSVPTVSLLDSYVHGETRNGDAINNFACLEAREETEANKVADAHGAGADQNEEQQTGKRQPFEAKRSSLERTEGKRTGAFTSLQLAAAAQYVATRNRVAGKWTRKQVSTGEEEVTAKASSEAALVCGRRSMAGDEALLRRKGGGRIRLFPHKKCAEDRKMAAGQGGVENNNTCSNMCQQSATLCDGSSGGGSESGHEIPRENQKHSVSAITHIIVRKHGDDRRQRVSQVEGDIGEYAVKRVARVCKRRTYVSSAKNSTGEQKVKSVTSKIPSGLARAGKLRLAHGKGRACSVAVDLPVAQERELRWLLQAQAYLLRQVSRRPGFLEVVMPAGENDKQHVLHAAWPESSGEKYLGSSGCRGEDATSREGTDQGPALSGRTIKPCYADSVASVPRLGIVQKSVTRSMPFMSSVPGQRTLGEGLLCRRGLHRESLAFQQSTHIRQRRSGLNEPEGRFTNDDVCGPARPRCLNRVLCVYAAGRFQLLLAEPEDENECCACHSVSTTADAQAAAGVVGTNHNCIPSRRSRACSCWVRLHARRRYRLRPDDVLRVGPVLEFSLKRFLTGVSSQQGYRLSMEDEEVVIQDLGVAEDVYCSYFAVYDGHGGRACAEFVKRVLHVTFRRELLRMCGGSLSVSSTVRQHVYQALLSSFLATDAAFLLEQQKRKRNGLLSTSGCACVVVVILGGEVWCANCGDARAVLCRGGKALELSSDHKPHRKDELQRIVAAGGFVRSKRVLGRLAVSRAFGDVDYKGARAHPDSISATATFLPPAASADPSLLRAPSCTTFASKTQNGLNGNSSITALQVFNASCALVTAVPEIRMQPLCEEDEFLLLACDGLFDVFTSQEAADFIQEALNGRFADLKDPQILVDALLYEAIEKRKSRDNVTAILVLLSPRGRSFTVASGGSRPRLQ